MSSQLIQDLEWRGLLKQSSDITAIQEALQTQQTFYCGFDPTADSLHIGNLLPLMALRRVQEHGHKAIPILGGGTGLIGDPSGKPNERTLNTPETVASYVKKIDAQVRTVLDPEKTIVVDNADWIASMSAVGAQAKPIRQPVIAKPLANPLIVITLSLMDSMAPMLACFPVKLIYS